MFVHSVSRPQKKRTELASVCYDPHIDIGNTDLGWCGVDYSEANCWRVIKAPRDNHVLLKWDNIRKPSTERLNVYDYQDGEWYKIAQLKDGEMAPKWGVISHNRRLCIHFVTDRSFLNSGASLRWRFTSTRVFFICCWVIRIPEAVFAFFSGSKSSPNY